MTILKRCPYVDNTLIFKGECNHPDRVYGNGYGGHLKCTEIRMDGERGGCPLDIEPMEE